MRTTKCACTCEI